MQPSEIEELPFYEIEYTIENLTNDVKNRKDSEEEQMNNYNTSDYMSQAKKMTGNSQSNPLGKSINIPKMPKMPGNTRIPR
jgi:hypothetical protein